MAGKSALARKLPWNDKAGRFAPLKALTLVLLPVPALVLLYNTLTVGLGARPAIEANHFLGDWTIYFLLITLAVTPARRLFEVSRLIQVRRMIGLTALFYILLHVTLYIVDSAFNLVFVAQEIVLRIYLTIGFVAVMGLVALGVTSTDGMVKRLGAPAWNRLHQIIYVIGFLAFLHYYMQAKADVTRAVLLSGFYFWLMGYRIMARLGYKQGFLPLVVLAVAAALTTAFAEAGWYQLVRPGIGMRALLANLDLSVDIRPAWWVLAAGLAVAVAAEIRRRIGQIRGAPRAASA
jgi:sulfoxide reductase heme-binding subunit YedZ